MLLTLVIYVCAIFCVYTIADHPGYPGAVPGGDLPTEEEKLEWMGVVDFNPYQQFGTIPRAMYTLFCVVILAEWMELGRALVEYQPWMIFFFLIFIIFTTFGVMNVIIGVIVDNTMEAAKSIEAEDEESEKARKLQLLQNIRDLVFSLDANG